MSSVVLFLLILVVGVIVYLSMKHKKAVSRSNEHREVQTVGEVQTVVEVHTVHVVT